jgi:Zn-dependent protease
MSLGGFSIFAISTWVLPVLLAITLHEAAHGYVAWKLGDDTAHLKGRVTFNPLKHVDLFGTIIVPALLIFVRAPFLFGWAKPVPVNFYRLRRPKRDMVWVALAGPGSNIVLAIVSAALLHLAPIFSGDTELWIVRMLQNSMFLNLVLAVFNMIPLPPLDGGRVAVGLLPPALARPLARLERFGFLILIGTLFFLPVVLEKLGAPINIFIDILLPPVQILFDTILLITGHI